VTNKKLEEYLSFSFKSDLNIKETAAAICENYSLSKPSLENGILTLKNELFLKIFTLLFRSTYLCESEFSYLKLTKSNLCLKRGTTIGGGGRSLAVLTLKSKSQPV
jgi:hypothetical protein